jgi:hypothetical protein
MSQLQLTLEISSIDAKSRTTETHELTADSEPEMARKIVQVWLDRYNDGWTETTRQCLQEFVDGAGENWGTAASKCAINSAYDLAQGATS